MAYGAPTVVDRPTRTQIPYGLFSVVDFRTDTTGGRWENGIEWDALTCSPASGIGDPLCLPSGMETTSASGLPKTPSIDGGIGEASRFTVYHLNECSPVGNTPEQAMADAQTALLLTEQARVEQALWLGDLGNEPNFQQAEVLTISQTNPAYVLGAVEQAVRDRYGALGVIHVGLIGAAVLREHDLIERIGSRYYTYAGTPLVIGTGYEEVTGGPTLGAATSGSVWMVGSSAIIGYRSEVFVSSARPGDLLDREVNTLSGIAERNYLLALECGTVAAEFEALEV
jgi:predicted RNase H-like HicB family nuclease